MKQTVDSQPLEALMEEIQVLFNKLSAESMAEDPQWEQALQRLEEMLEERLEQVAALLPGVRETKHTGNPPNLDLFLDQPAGRHSDPFARQVASDDSVIQAEALGWISKLEALLAELEDIAACQHCDAFLEVCGELEKKMHGLVPGLGNS